MDAKERLIRLSDGSSVEHDTLRIVEKLREYNDRLDVKYLGHGGSLTDAPYALFERCPDGIERKVFDIWELDDRVMQRLYAADTQRNDILAGVDAANFDVKKLQQRRFKETQAEIADIVTHMAKASGGRYSFIFGNKKVTVDDDPKARAKVELKD